MDLRGSLRFTFALCLATVSALAGPSGGTSGRLEAEVRRLLQSAQLGPYDSSITVINDNGRRVVAIESGKAFKPASNMKILTTLAGLDLLGAGYEFETRILSKAPFDKGLIAGDVVIRGNGDPNISGRFHGGNPLALFQAWARKLRAVGLREIQGDLIADDSFFDDVRFLPGWKRTHAGRWFAAEISALSLNDNCVDVRITPTTPGASARVETVPKSSFVEVVGAPVTVRSGATKVTIHRSPNSNRIEISGRVSVKEKEWRDHVAITDPAFFFVYTLKDVFADQGIRVRGKVRRSDASGDLAARRDTTKSPPKKPATDPMVTLLVEHKSSLLLDLPVINKRSQNLHAEILLKTLGARHGGEASVVGGGRAIRKFLKTKGISANELIVADGSGLSHDNRVTTEMLARALHLARKAKYFQVFLGSLAVAGGDGTLKSRFRRAPELHGCVFAKSGYIDDVSGLSGYLRRDSRIWSFSMLFRKLPGGNSSIKQLQECIVAAIDGAH